MTKESPDVNSPEFFGLEAGNKGYDTFDQDFPTSETTVVDYPTADFEMGETVSNGPVVFPETAEQEAQRINAWLRENYPSQ